MVAALLIGALLSSLATAQFGEIRGRSFELGTTLELDGGIGGVPLQLAQGEIALPSQMQGLEVLPDPAAPGDPERVLVRLRLPPGADLFKPLHFELRGRWDAATGRLEVSDTLPGAHAWQTPYLHDAFGALPKPASLWLIFVEPRVELVAAVTVSPGDSQVLGLVLTGGDLDGTPGLAARISATAIYASWAPPGTDSPFAALVGPVRVGLAAVLLHDLQAEYRFLLGDLDHDALYTDCDLTLMQSLSGTASEPGNLQSLAADMNADGQIGVADEDWLRLMLRLFPAPPVVTLPTLPDPLPPASAGSFGTKAPL